MSKPIEDRITNLEIKLSFTEDLIEKLNETVYKQQQQIEFLYRELKAVKEQASSGGSGSLKDEIPPHY
jgi:SlyX protein